MLCTVHGTAPKLSCDGCYPAVGDSGRCVHGVALGYPCHHCHVEEDVPRRKVLHGQLVEDIATGIRVLRTRDGMPVIESQVMDRARNIAAALLGNYRIEAL